MHVSRTPETRKVSQSWWDVITVIIYDDPSERFSFRVYTRWHLKYGWTLDRMHQSALVSSCVFSHIFTTFSSHGAFSINDANNPATHVTIIIELYNMTHAQNTELYFLKHIETHSIESSKFLTIKFSSLEQTNYLVNWTNWLNFPVAPTETFFGQPKFCSVNQKSCLPISKQEFS